ncbi:hypothetical protein EPI10_016302 [Gossypium australe]|uniref:Uncharacterized protein n=1 Tax=Gossypium australe TaxID=47621 RepID=A0A5B6VN74_9ROSI|nr:hypothetical protein EPI10_016302 [Gossypium australe]
MQGERERLGNACLGQNNFGGSLLLKKPYVIGCLGRNTSQMAISSTLKKFDKSSYTWSNIFTATKDLENGFDRQVGDRKN